MFPKTRQAEVRSKLSQHHTPDFVYLQAYEDELKANRLLNPLNPTDSAIFGNLSYRDPIIKNPRPETLVMTFQGKFVRARVVSHSHQPPTRHKRSKITDFSPGSRGRLFDLFNKMEVKSKVVFITLTYLSEDIDCDLAKSNLFAFIKRLQRLHKNREMAFVWRMEFQERGAIHFHIMAFGLPFTPKDQIQKMWGEIICQVQPFTRIEMIFSSKKVMNYVSKYVAKVNPASEIGGFNLPTYLAAYQSKHGDDIGRVWGIIGKKYLPMAELVTLELGFNYAKFMQFRLIASHQYPPLWDSLSLGFRLYVLSAKQWEHWFHCIYDIVF